MPSARPDQHLTEDEKLLVKLGLDKCHYAFADKWGNAVAYYPTIHRHRIGAALPRERFSPLAESMNSADFHIAVIRQEFRAVG